jgi:hypothetical protein
MSIEQQNAISERLHEVSRLCGEMVSINSKSLTMKNFYVSITKIMALVKEIAVIFDEVTAI